MTAPQAIHPSGFRVWRGFRHPDYEGDRCGFIDKLASVFIPVTCQAMMPMGLQSYLPALIESENYQLPDEIALVGYSSQEIYYQASRTSVIGRSYADMHKLVFNYASDCRMPASQSCFPVPWRGELKLSEPCYFTGQRVNWSLSPVSMYALPLPDSTAEAQQQAQRLAQTVATMAAAAQFQDAILVQDPGYMILWVAEADGSDVDIAQAAGLDNWPGKVVLPVVTKQISPMWSTGDSGPQIEDNQGYNLTLKS